ncbi:MAG: DMT family transporter [Desulfobacter sp.]|nr:MAG: DMT family transporter [Desulfobacter sp.]
MELILLVVALVAGMMAPLQAGLNGKMGRALGDPYYAALISFAVGTMGLLCYALAGRVEFQSIRNAFSLHWAVWLAGLLGAFYVSATIVLMPKLGSTLTFSLVVAGQLLMAVILDHYGLLGVPVQLFNWQRLLGVALVVTGVALIR